MTYPTNATLAVQQAIPNSCTAKTLPPSDRLQLGLHALAGCHSISTLADDADVSRKFVYQQAAIAQQALNDAFAPHVADDDVLFYLPVTKAWLRQFILALVLICHSPLRGVVEVLRDLFDYEVSLGTVHNVVHAAVAPARALNQAQDLSRVRIGAHDEMFQAQQPVLVGVDVHSSYCYLLSLEEQRDADTWSIRLLEAQQRQFAPDAVIGDAGTALRAAHKQVLPGCPCRSDVWHALHELYEAVSKLEHRAYRLMTRCHDLVLAQARHQQRHGRADRALVKQLSDASKQETLAIALADDVALLVRWLHHEVLSLAGPTHAERLALYDFLQGELQARVPQTPALLSRVVNYVKNQRDDLLAFAAQLDRDLEALAEQFAVRVSWVRSLFNVQTLSADQPQRWQREAPWRQQLGARYWPLSQALQALRQDTVRASSMVENLNSRLRSYFFLRRHLGNDYLALLQFFLNHRRLARSAQEERVEHSPAEVLTGQRHAHWLELLGYQRFSRN
jgi:hypothetical protein